MYKLLPSSVKFLLVPLLVGLTATSFPVKANASAVNVAARALAFTVKRTSAFVATYAAAHTASGTGAPGSGLCTKFSITGAGVGCNSSDFFGHPTPPGNDFALASSFAQSRLFGFDTTANTNTSTGKGDFALAGAYAKGGGNIDTSGSVKFNLNLTLGRLTLTAALDPGIATYNLAVSDLDPDFVNQDVLNPFMANELQSQGFTLSQPTTTFYDLSITFNAETGDFSVENTSDFIVGSLLTEEDFEVGMFPDEDVFGNMISRPGVRLKEESRGDIVLELPGDSSDTFISVDAQQFEIATTPEPTSTLGLLALGTLGAASTLKRKLKQSKSPEKETTKVG